MDTFGKYLFTINSPVITPVLVPQTTTSLGNRPGGLFVRFLNIRRVLRAFPVERIVGNTVYL